MTAEQSRWMAVALRKAGLGLYSTPPNPSVGCVIVHQGELVSSGWHQKTGGAHAEVMALEGAAVPPGADFYVTLEPCSHHGRTPPCVDSVLAARPAQVVIAMQDCNPRVAGRSIEKLRQQGITVTTGILEAGARGLNRGFIKRMEQGLPFVSVKMASSLDGRSALSNGVSQWITGEPARRDVQFMRARASAILTSAETVISDNPSLDVRLSADDLGQSLPVRQPARVVVDSRLRLSGEEKIFTTGGEIWIATTSEDQQKRHQLEQLGAHLVDTDAAEDGRVDLPSLMRLLAQREVNEIHCECGARLAGALIRQRLADQVLLYQAPHLLGSRAQGVFDIGELTDMSQRVQTRVTDLRRIGDDLRLTLKLDD